MTETKERTPLARAGRWGLGLAAAGAGLSALSTLLARDAERRVPADGDAVEVDGARLHYVDRGRGDPIVMVHGLGGQLRNFTHSLAARLEKENRLIVVDRPGAGYSIAPPGPRPDIRHQARLVLRLIEKLGLERPLLVGHSLGGAVALAAALGAPGLLGGLALLAPLTQPLDQAPEALRLLARESRASRTLMARVYGVPFGRLMQRVNLRAIFAPDPVPGDFPTEGGGLLALRPRSLEAAIFEINAAKDDMEAIAPRYGEIGLPVSILFGRRDALLDPELHGRKTADALPKGELELIDGGHMLPVTHPDETAAFVRRALARAES